MGILEEIRVGYDLFRPGGSEPPGNLFIQGGFEYEIYSVVEAANREHKSTNSILLSLRSFISDFRLFNSAASS